ncbi:MAG: EAL domain-containing protein [Acidimicrobiales bacterium]
MAATTVLAAVPPLESAAGAVMLVFLGGYVVASWSRRGEWMSLPRSLRWTHISIGIIVLGTLVRGAETAASDGHLTVPSWADLISIPGLIGMTISLFAAARARAATSRLNDVVDAVTTMLVPITAVALVGWPYLVGGTGAPVAERVVAGGVYIVDIVFLTLVLLMVYGPGSRSRAAVWLGLSGALGSLFDLSLFYGVATDAWWKDQPVRILALPLVTYAIAVSASDYGEFAKPGTREQKYRWQIYPVALCSIGYLALISHHLLAIVSFVAVTALSSVRISLAGQTALRLTDIVQVQSRLAEELSKASTIGAAIEAARGACRSLLGDRSVVVLAQPALVEELDLSAARDRTVIKSALANVAIAINGGVPPHLYVAITQVANVLDPALASIDERARRMELEAEAKAEEAWNALASASREVGLRAVDGRIIKATPNAARELGFDPVGRLVGQVTSLSHPLANGDSAYQDPYRHGRWIKTTSTDQPDGSTIFTIRDVTAEHRAARTDPATGLPNLVDYNRSDELTDVVVTVLYFHDVDRARETSGAGDDLFGELATRTMARFRRDEDQIWRGEGATLIVVSPGTTSVEWIENRRAELAADVEELLPITPSVTAGAVRVEDSMSPAGALLRADMAVKHAQIHAPGTTTFFTAELQERIKRTWQIEARLTSALNDSDPGEHGFRVEYQPIVDARSRVATTAEALVRWTHPDLGPIFPDEFIPLAEKHRVVDRIDRFVLRTSLRDLREFRRYHPDFKVHVNVSPAGLAPEKLDRLCGELQADSLAGHIVIEITEASLGSQNLPELAAACERIAREGVLLSIDDFGTGESNFTRISQLPVSEVKLARHFAESKDALMVESVVQTLHTLHKSVVAENVETEEQAHMLTSSGVDDLQGYLFSKPRPFVTVLEWLTEQTNRPPLTDGHHVGAPCQDGPGQEHEACLGWWQPKMGDAITCACPCHARTGTWTGWHGYTLDLSNRLL